MNSFIQIKPFTSRLYFRAIQTIFPNIKRYKQATLLYLLFVHGHPGSAENPKVSNRFAIIPGICHYMNENCGQILHTGNNLVEPSIPITSLKTAANPVPGNINQHVALKMQQIHTGNNQDSLSNLKDLSLNGKWHKKYSSTG